MRMQKDVARPLFVRAVVQGVPTIQDGREFLFSPSAIEDGQTFAPPRELGMSSSGEECIVRVAGVDTPAQCPHCGSVLQYAVAGHTWDWMTGVFYCPNHPLEVWVDYYPKRCSDTSQDSLNAWPQYADRAKKIPMASPQQLLRHQVISNEDEVETELERERRKAPLKYKLTPAGLVPIDTTATGLNLAGQLVRWLRSLIPNKAAAV